VVLKAVAMTSIGPASCKWVCTCGGTITIDGSDGLPVELMEFEVAAQIETDDEDTVSEK